MRHNTKLSVAAMAAVGVVGAMTPRAEATLIIDVRATSLNGNSLAEPKGVFVATGDVVTLGLFARVSGTNGVNDETLQSAHGAIISSGSLLGNLAGGPVAPFNGSGSQNGSVQDLDADGDLDIGVAPNGGTPTTGFFIARSSQQESNGTVVDANTREFQIGQVSFTVTGVAGTTFINFVRRANASGGNIITSGVWAVDGTVKNPTGDTMGSGSPVVINPDPEPSALTLAAVTGLGLLARRSRRTGGL
jgi:hypothetical protein